MLFFFFFFQVPSKADFPILGVLAHIFWKVEKAKEVKFSDRLKTHIAVKNTGKVNCEELKYWTLDKDNVCIMVFSSAESLAVNTE